MKLPATCDLSFQWGLVDTTLHLGFPGQAWVTCKAPFGPPPVQVGGELGGDDAPLAGVAQHARGHRVAHGALAERAPRRQHVRRVAHEQRDAFAACAATGSRVTGLPCSPRHSE